MIKVLALSALLAPGPVEGRARDNPKVKNFAISVGVILAANLIMYSPLIMANLQSEE